MENTNKFPKTSAQEALRILEDSLSYYTPQPKPIGEQAGLDERVFYPYYEAA